MSGERTYHVHFVDIVVVFMALVVGLGFLTICVLASMYEQSMGSPEPACIAAIGAIAFLSATGYLIYKLKRGENPFGGDE